MNVEDIREGIKGLINKHREGVTVDEILVGAKGYKRSQISRAVRYLYNTKQIDKIDNIGGVQVYKPVDNPKVYNGLDIAELYFKYERGTVKLNGGNLRTDDRKELEIVLTDAYNLQDTYKEITLKVRMYDEEKNRVATLIYSPKGDKGIMYEIGALIPKTESELLDFVRRGEVI